MNHDFLSCDWGTTSFRLRWVVGEERKVVREICEPAGVKSLYEEAARIGAASETARANVFSDFLRAKLEALFAGEKFPERAMPLVISGMASSSIGWRELPYAPAPFPLDGRGLRFEELHWNKPSWVGPTYLISGIATGHEMMRGEETEIIGLMSDPSFAALRERCLLILPGTHSKHVRIDDQSVVDFRTFMTGELFEVLGRYSILRASVDVVARGEGDMASFSDSARAAFQEGVRWSQEHGLAGGLFRVRTRAVLGDRPLAENTWFMSGILIGAECLGMRSADRTVVLAAPRGLSELYALALETVAGRTKEWIQLPHEQVEQATIAAHDLFLQTEVARAMK